VDVERCFVHMDYETDHAPEYKRRLHGSPPPSPAATPPESSLTKRTVVVGATAAALPN